MRSNATGEGPVSWKIVSSWKAILGDSGSPSFRRDGACGRKKEGRTTTRGLGERGQDLQIGGSRDEVAIIAAWLCLPLGGLGEGGTAPPCTAAQCRSGNLLLLSRGGQSLEDPEERC